MRFSTPLDAVIGLTRSAFRMPKSWMEGVAFGFAWVVVAQLTYIAFILIRNWLC